VRGREREREREGEREREREGERERPFPRGNQVSARAVGLYLLIVDVTV
jgi:hypothetical protein